MFEMRGLYDEIDILWYQSGAEKINKTIKINIWLILCYILIKNDQKRPKNVKKYQKSYDNLDDSHNTLNISKYIPW